MRISRKCISVLCKNCRCLNIKIQNMPEVFTWDINRLKKLLFYPPQPRHKNGISCDFDLCDQENLISHIGEGSMREERG